MKLFELKNNDSFPAYADNQWNLLTRREKQAKLYSLAAIVVNAFLDLSLPSSTICMSSQSDTVKPDLTLEYAKELLSLGLLYMEFQDAIREGDEEHVLNCWRYLMLI
uniref:Uncharacterized protein n=1 Tax=Amphimedon queenslandica TaxID=400682 RepID=A0A1X7U075_AMPQE